MAKLTSIEISVEDSTSGHSLVLGQSCIVAVTENGKIIVIPENVKLVKIESALEQDTKQVDSSGMVESINFIERADCIDLYFEGVEIMSYRDASSMLIEMFGNKNNVGINSVENLLGGLSCVKSMDFFMALGSGVKNMINSQRK